jgi:hypothetical protein
MNNKKPNAPQEKHGSHCTCGACMMKKRESARKREEEKEQANKDRVKKTD